MSKHMGNVVDPWDGAGSSRARTPCAGISTPASAPWLPSRFSAEAVSEAQRKFMGTLLEHLRVLRALREHRRLRSHGVPAGGLPSSPRWTAGCSRGSTRWSRTWTSDLDKLRITEGGRALQAFVDELCNWYVRRCRERFWGSEMAEDKKAAFMTLYTVLHTLTLLTAPFVPFMTEEIYQNLVRSVDATAPESVHFCDYPGADESRIDAELEANMARVLDIVTLGRAARNDGAVKTRQPLALMYIQGEPMDDALCEHRHRRAQREKGGVRRRTLPAF